MTKAPKRISDPDMGNFTYDEDSYAYVAKSVKWCGQKVKFHLSVEEPEEREQRFAEARTVWEKQKQWQKKSLDYAANELLEEANDWLTGEDQKAITASAFKKRIALASVEFHEDGDITFFFDTENIFAEKGVCVFANVSGQFTEATND